MGEVKKKLHQALLVPITAENAGMGFGAILTRNFLKKQTKTGLEDNGEMLSTQSLSSWYICVPLYVIQERKRSMEYKIMGKHFGEVSLALYHC